LLKRVETSWACRNYDLKRDVGLGLDENNGEIMRNRCVYFVTVELLHAQIMNPLPGCAKIVVMIIVLAGDQHAAVIYFS
jgi:hypothetical protein